MAVTRNEVDASSTNSVIYCVIRNIPVELHSADLRNFFSLFTEGNSFQCFHFRHRPEVKTQTLATSSSSSSNKTTCCIVAVKSNKYDEFVNKYNRKHWLNRSGDIMPIVAFIDKLKLAVHLEANDKTALKLADTADGIVDSDWRQTFTQDNLYHLPELRPPALFPQGNVGTPTRKFLSLIKQCLLPAKLVGKLGLSFPRRRPRKQYSSVPFEYGHSYRETYTSDGTTNTDRLKHLYSEDTSVKGSCTTDDEEETQASHESSEDDADECEEWERHEAFTDDPGTQERNKERLYEEEIELQWEKGGSGAVFYTDAQYWQAAEGDFDEQTADDWDVDTSIYYEQSAGDMDARDSLTMRQEAQRRNAPISPPSLRESHQGLFEKHTKGIGRKLLRRQGWKEGDGLGASVRGISSPLDSAGQSGRNKSGLGYRGEKLQFGKFTKSRKKSHLITTCYDERPEVDRVEGVYRTSEPSALKYRRDTVRGTKHS